MLGLSGDALGLMLIHFPTGDSTGGGFAGNFQVLYFHFLLSSPATHSRSSLELASGQLRSLSTNGSCVFL